MTSAGSHMRDEDARWQAVYQKIVDNAHHLVRQGAVVAKRTSAGRRVWVVRFTIREGQKKIQRMIYIGHQPGLLRRAQALLETCRQRRYWLKEVARHARWAQAARAVMKRMLVPSTAGLEA
jgi:hypothetical protein